MIMDALVGHLRRLDERAAYFAPRHVAALRQIFPTLAAIPAFVEPEARSPAGRGHELRLRAAGAFHELFARVATRYQVVIPNRRCAVADRGEPGPPQLAPGRR